MYWNDLRRKKLIVFVDYVKEMSLSTWKNLTTKMSVC